MCEVQAVLLPDCVIEHDVETCEEMVEAFGEDGE